MIKASELRIGNLITWNPKLVHPNSTLSPLHIQVQSIVGDRISYVFPNIENRVEPFEDDVAQNGNHKQLTEVEPIKLTREILETALIGPTDSVMKQQEDGLHIEWTTPDFKVTYLKANILYVHQLQNLYFALTRHELDIDIKETL
jgi:hypothetical protein